MQGVEDSNLLIGYVASFLGDFNTAQEFFLQSSNRLAALDVRTVLLVCVRNE